jgi:hypothetical protein
VTRRVPLAFFLAIDKVDAVVESVEYGRRSAEKPAVKAGLGRPSATSIIVVAADGTSFVGEISSVTKKLTLRIRDIWDGLCMRPAMSEDYIWRGKYRGAT